MRLWTIHPKYLDTKGLLATWREGLLARKVLEGKTKGYKNHPQLERFKSYKKPLKAIDAYLYQVWIEAKQRGYNFDKKKINQYFLIDKIPVKMGQVTFEFKHLLNKLKLRNPQRYHELKTLRDIDTNLIFNKIPGKRETWEVVKDKD